MDEIKLNLGKRDRYLLTYLLDLVGNRKSCELLNVFKDD